jgi:hypothetical protein
LGGISGHSLASQPRIFVRSGSSLGFAPPWTSEVTPNYYVVRDANRQQLAYVYFENEPGRRSAAKLLSKDEARRIAANIAKLPGLVRKQD